VGVGKRGENTVKKTRGIVGKGKKKVSRAQDVEGNGLEGS